MKKAFIIPFLLLWATPSPALENIFDTFYEFGRRGESGVVEEEDLTDEFYYEKYDIKFLQKLDAKTSYYIKYQYYHKDFDTLQNLDNNFHLFRFSLDTILYKKDDFSIKMGPDLELKEKIYKDSTNLDYNQIKFDLPFILKKEADWTIKAMAGINSYTYPNAPTDQFKMNARFDIAKKFFDERLEVATFYKYQYIERQKIANRLEQTYGGSVEVKLASPFIRAFVISPADSLGNVMQLCQERRGEYKSTEYLDPTRAMLVYEFPLSEIIVDFYDKIKSMTRGYGSLDYEFKEYKPSDLVKLDILINGKPCDALSFIVHKDNAHSKGNQLVTKLKELIPRQLFEVALQAAIGSKIIARETVRPVGKNVTAKCYGGDISRKRKLWEKQKEGKKRMKQFGKVEIPQEAFMAVLKL